MVSSGGAPLLVLVLDLASMGWLLPGGCLVLGRLSWCDIRLLFIGDSDGMSNKRSDLVLAVEAIMALFYWSDYFSVAMRSYGIMVNGWVGGIEFLFCCGRLD